MPAMDYAQVAELYDVYVRTEIDVPFFSAEAQGCRSVLELTSGTGRLSVPLLEAGVPLTCLDSSAEMLAVLRRKLRERGIDAPVYEMDATDFSLDERFDLIVIPFNSFAEFVEPAVQRNALETIGSHLAEGGRFICTLHNPAIRRKAIDGQIHERGRFSLPDGQGTLVLSSRESHDNETCIVTGTQCYDIYDAAGALQSKLEVPIRFHLHSRETFEVLAQTQGYRVAALYGDYERSPFDRTRSPFMIWILTKS